MRCAPYPRPKRRRSRPRCCRSIKRPMSASSPSSWRSREQVAADAVTHQIPSEDDEAENVILASIDRFLERDVAPYAQKLEHDDVYPEEIVARMKELGLFGATINTAYGGL